MGIRLRHVIEKLLCEPFPLFPLLLFHTPCLLTPLLPFLTHPFQSNHQTLFLLTPCSFGNWLFLFPHFLFPLPLPLYPHIQRHSLQMLVEVVQTIERKPFKKGMRERGGVMCDFPSFFSQFLKCEKVGRIKREGPCPIALSLPFIQ